MAACQLLIFRFSRNFCKRDQHIINLLSATFNILKDEVFLDQKTIELIKHYEQISEGERGVENITYDDAIPYLLKKRKTMNLKILL